MIGNQEMILHFTLFLILRKYYALNNWKWKEELTRFTFSNYLQSNNINNLSTYLILNA